MNVPDPLDPVDPIDPAASHPLPEWQLIRVHPHAPHKPAWGAPCNGCGVCCLIAPCPLGMLYSRRRTGACDALRWHGPERRYTCGVLGDPALLWGRRGVASRPVRWLTRLMAPSLKWLVRRWIAAGQGCDSTAEVDEPPV